MQANSENEKPPNLTETIAEQWEAFAEFAGRLTREIAGMGRRGQRGFLKNVEILEAWIRAALLQLAEQIELPLRKRKVRRDRQVAAEATEPAAVQTRDRRAGFRAIEPDDYEQHMLAQAASAGINARGISRGWKRLAQCSPRRNFMRGG